MKLVEFGEISNEEWDHSVSKMPESTYFHSSFWINYLNAINGRENSKSFILMENNEPIAVCPLAVYNVTKNGMEYAEATFKGVPIPLPAIVQLPPIQRKRTAIKVYSALFDALKPSNVKRIEFYRHPISLDFLNGNTDPSNIAEAQSFSYLYYIQNTIVADLKKPESVLSSELSKYQRKHVRKSDERGLKVLAYEGQGSGADEAFARFRGAHLKSAGRLTRPSESWDLMLSFMKQGKAALFTSSIDGKEISYLYCGQFGKFAWGWSQVNLDEYEKEYSPRHQLEWEAMMHYRKKGFSCYEIGYKYDSPQIHYVPTEKDITISHLKERFGGKLYPYLHFERFFDKVLFKKAYDERISNFLASDYFSMDKGMQQADEQE